MSNTLQTSNFNDQSSIIPVIFVLDTSSSSKPCDWLNQMMENTIFHLKEENLDLEGHEIRIGILNSDMEWITGDSLVPIQKVSWSSMEPNTKESLKDIALQLSECLTEDELLSLDRSYLRPCVIVLSNGEASDKDIYFESNITDLWDNPMYRSSNRCIITQGTPVKDELYVNLIRQGTYLDILDMKNPMIYDLAYDLLLNQWSAVKTDISSKYEDLIEIRNVMIEE